MSEYQTVGAESPVPVVIADWGVYPLTACCKATGKGWMDDDGSGGVVCRKCFEWVSDYYGMSWMPGDNIGWAWYAELVLDEVWDLNATSEQNRAKVAEVVAHVREKVEAAAKLGLSQPGGV